MCLVFLYYPKKILFVCEIMGVGKNNNEKDAIVLYVVMFGDKKDVDHS